MEKDRSCMTEKILKLTLEIIYILTAEDYGPMKKSKKHETSSSPPSRSGGCCRSQSPISNNPSKLLMHERNNDQKILELTNKIIELLTGEVSAKFRDENGDTPIEDWEYLGECTNLNKKVRMENHQCRTLPDFTDDTELSRGSPSPISLQDRMIDHNIAVTIGTAKYSSDFPNIIDRAEKSMKPPVLCKERYPTKTKMYTRTQYTQCSPLCVKEESIFGGGKSISDAELYSRTDHSPYTYFHTKEKSMSDKAGKLTDSEMCTDPQRYINMYAPIDYNGKSRFPQIKEEPVPGDEENLMDHPLSWAYTKSDSKFKKKVPMCFICVECGKNFPYKSHLLRHQKIHMEERPYSCLECGKSFKLNSNLISHQRIHTGQRPFSCSDCGKCFISKSELVKHERIHTGEKPYPCLECGRRFSRVSNLIDHNKIHTGEKPYCCSECGKCFRRHSNLQSHQKTHTMDKV